MKENLTFAEKDLANLLRVLQTQLSPLKTDAFPSQDLIIVLTSTSFGHGNEELGKILMKFFLKSLTSNVTKPKLIILINDGIFLAAEDSQVIGSFSVLQEQGINILVDGTSVDYYQAEEKIKIGQVVSMLTICTELMNAGRVLSL